MGERRHGNPGWLSCRGKNHAKRSARIRKMSLPMPIPLTVANPTHQKAASIERPWACLYYIVYNTFHVLTLSALMINKSAHKVANTNRKAIILYAFIQL